MSRKTVVASLVVLMVLTLVVSVVMAAEEKKPDPPRRERGPGRTERGSGRPERGSGRDGMMRGMADFQKRMMDRYKENLGASDAEWKVIEPKLTKVMELSRESRFSGMRGIMGMFGRGRGGSSRGGSTRGGSSRGGSSRTGRESDRPVSAIQKASTALSTVLENKSSSTKQIKAKLLALRKAKEKAQQKVAAAQKDLKSVLTVRQEATLVASGILN